MKKKLSCGLLALTMAFNSAPALLNGSFATIGAVDVFASVTAAAPVGVMDGFGDVATGTIVAALGGYTFTLEKDSAVKATLAFENGEGNGKVKTTSTYNDEDALTDCNLVVKKGSEVVTSVTVGGEEYAVLTKTVSVAKGETVGVIDTITFNAIKLKTITGIVLTETDNTAIDLDPDFSNTVDAYAVTIPYSASPAINLEVGFTEATTATFGGGTPVNLTSTGQAQEITLTDLDSSASKDLVITAGTETVTITITMEADTNTPTTNTVKIALTDTAETVDLAGSDESSYTYKYAEEDAITNMLATETATAIKYYVDGTEVTAEKPTDVQIKWTLASVDGDDTDPTYDKTEVGVYVYTASIVEGTEATNANVGEYELDGTFTFTLTVKKTLEITKDTLDELNGTGDKETGLDPTIKADVDGDSGELTFTTTDVVFAFEAQDSDTAFIEAIVSGDVEIVVEESFTPTSVDNVTDKYEIELSTAIQGDVITFIDKETATGEITFPKMTFTFDVASIATTETQTFVLGVFKAGKLERIIEKNEIVTRTSDISFTEAPKSGESFALMLVDVVVEEATYGNITVTITDLVDNLDYTAYLDGKSVTVKGSSTGTGTTTGGSFVFEDVEAKTYEIGDLKIISSAGDVYTNSATFTVSEESSSNDAFATATLVGEYFTKASDEDAADVVGGIVNDIIDSGVLSQYDKDLLTSLVVSELTSELTDDIESGFGLNATSATVTVTDDGTVTIKDIGVAAHVSDGEDDTVEKISAIGITIPLESYSEFYAAIADMTIEAIETSVVDEAEGEADLKEALIAFDISFGSGFDGSFEEALTITLELDSGSALGLSPSNFVLLNDHSTTGPGDWQKVDGAKYTTDEITFQTTDFSPFVGGTGVVSSTYVPSGGSTGSSGGSSSGYTSYSAYTTNALRVNGTVISELQNISVGEMINLDKITTINGRDILGWYTDSALTKEITNTSTFVVTSDILANGLFVKLSGGVSETLPDGSYNAGAGSDTTGTYTPSTVPSTIAKLLGKLF